MNKFKSKQIALLKQTSKLLLTSGIALQSAVPAYALPADDSNMAVDAGAATYNYNGGTQQGTLTFGQNNSMVTFAAIEPVAIDAGETLNVVPGATGDSSWVGVLRDNNSSGVASVLNGTLAQSMQLFFLNANGIVTGDNFSVDFSGVTNAAGGLVLS
ncbi:MAG: hypothetical protein HKO71_05115, partial [Pseudomonadales bacterium]|nr:hypothetical protein [Pseudomonadales bacterium]